MTSKVLITGFTGMVGSFMAEYLLKNTDWQIYGLLRWRSDTRNNENIIEEIKIKDLKKLILLIYNENKNKRLFL